MAQRLKTRQSKRFPYFMRKGFGVLRKGKNAFRSLYRSSMNVPILRSIINEAIESSGVGPFVADGAEVLGDTIDKLAKA